MKLADILPVLTASLICASCSSNHLESRLMDYIADKDATIGIAVITDKADTIEINGNRRFPMLSVYKFPIAIAFSDYCRDNGISFNDSCTISKQEIEPDTYSPMLQLFGRDDSLRVSYHDLLTYSLQLSDNNASDILLNKIGGPERVMTSLAHYGLNDAINISSSEAEMHEDNELCYANSSTPLAIATLFDKYSTEANDSLSRQIKRIMEGCLTGGDRLAGPIIRTGATFGHKTGTGFMLPNGRLMAVNDAGYVITNDGQRYAIAVLIENSGYDMAQTAAIIADLSAIITDNLISHQ